ncbi:MAG: exodeoxyribonuclease VII large subunit [Candidatus Omnitrophota bacterium]
MKENRGIGQDLFSQPDEKSPRHILSVSEITQGIKFTLESTFSEVWVEGEISGVSKISTGTVFFSLKDDKSILKCVIFYSFSRALKAEIKDGMKVICFGRVSVYEKDGKYQLYVEKIEPKGIGSLQLALEQLKEKLEKEGLFALEHKKPIPYLPARIGVVTSATGAAIRDMLKVLDERFRDVHIIINPVRVQGEGAKEEIASAITEFNTWGNIDVMIVGRGGGSIEDLWAFNEEIVARAIYQSAIPVISAVGHERDWTIADLVADKRAATPSVAAEMVIPKKEDLQEQLEGLVKQLKRSLSDISLGFQEDLDSLAHRLRLASDHALELNAQHLESTIKKLALLNPVILIPQYKTKVLDLAKQMSVGMKHLFALKESGFTKAIEKLANLNPLNILSRGYSVTFKLPELSVVKDAFALKKHDAIKTRFQRGTVISRVEEVERDGA